jgi:ADP-ribose pyrophosphatase YjhB (NUDIX family)
VTDDALLSAEAAGVAEAIPRPAARVLLIDEAGRVLLFHGYDPARPSHDYWVTPGGGLDPGEGYADGAARELFEETGLRVEPESLGEPVFRDLIEFPFDGRWYRAEQRFYLVRVDAWEVDTAGFDEIERACTYGYHWWSADELAGTDEPVYPTGLADLLRTLVGV